MLKPYHRQIPLYTLEGVRDAHVSPHAFTSGDKLGLSMLRFQREPSEDVVLIIHGLTTSTDMFIMPEHYNLVSYLLDHGFPDVWTLDFRMSNRFPYNLQRQRFDMDDIAAFDFPAAIAELRAQVGPDARIHVICHCLGAVSFMMSLFGRAVTGITSVIANSVALTPRVPNWSKVKLWMAPFFLEQLAGMPYLNAAGAEEGGLSRNKLLAKVAGLIHRECDVPACHTLSLMWGTGFPALYSHENLQPVTHERGGDLYGATGFHYYRHVRKMVKAGGAVKYDRRKSSLSHLPDDYFQYAKDIQTPVLFYTGADNHVFTDSNIVCHQRLETLVPGRHALRVVSGYGHQDVFMGKDCHRDVFPHFVSWLEKHRGTRSRPLRFVPSPRPAEPPSAHAH
ncbi:alpha/beta hydrolase [Corallococcus sicarius]|uniref:Alpha/beta fold hydrolase n=1 Tax=Corallococcus sicarius TaxID=2316726 RepID=A0A3A8NWA6_9BACT|nr:alpha/beta fold hydrolase [Corallococcus sicarius]RKH48363.1 alpha/beta fold hydrolase [Corallococcus sicarius]